uniref:Uncharacterized protein n=1 Tax=Eptatretus burgeri TaxID=7764 RepID=A0A8C4Q2C6_EPTBU
MLSYVDECEMEGSCIDGLCHNTHGSYVCHCEAPLSPDISEPGQSAVFLDVCWKDVSHYWMCGQPFTKQKTTYTECCCLHGRAWGVECALCPPETSGRTDEVAGLQAQECGIAHGCENGRCVRVPDGFTCDCYDGFHLNLVQVICVDVDECAEMESVCMHGRCLNTEGSYQCVCDWGYTQVLFDSPQCVPDPSTWHTIRQQDG